MLSRRSCVSCRWEGRGPGKGAPGKVRARVVAARTSLAAGSAKMPLVTGIASTREMFAEAIGVPVAKVVERFKTGIDATLPCGADPFRFERIRIPGERELDLAAYGIQWNERALEQVPP
jgi:hypothetical protein